MTTSLKSLSLAKNIPFGCVVSGSKTVGDAAYKTMVDSNCALLIFENSFKWKFLEPTRGNIKWSSLDTGIQYCKDNGIQLKLHCLFWHKSTPDWVKNLSPDELKNEMIKRMRDTKNRFDSMKDLVYGIDVVNEAISSSGGVRSSVFSQKLGQNWIEKAYKWAREVFGSDYRLIYNDYNMENTPAKNRRILALTKTLKSQNLVDEIGFQFHFSYKTGAYSSSSIAALLKKYVDLDVDVSISEMDVRMNKGTQVSQEVLATQGEFVKQVIQGALTHSSRLKSICCWGISDKFSWIENDIPLPCDIHYTPKPFHAALVSCYESL